MLQHFEGVRLPAFHVIGQGCYSWGIVLLTSGVFHTSLSASYESTFFFRMDCGWSGLFE